MWPFSTTKKSEEKLLRDRLRALEQEETVQRLRHLILLHERDNADREKKIQDLLKGTQP